MPTAAVNPQNPYASYIVQASAGCGKTYQLSRRFLFLVGAGASPGAILTITFTKKAANEMRERILGEAARLVADPSAQRDFERSLAEFHKYAQTLNQASGEAHRLMPPRRARDTGREILASSQLLRIATIDSIFMDWIRKFPWEASEASLTERSVMTPQAKILSVTDEKRLHLEAWQLACEALARPGELSTFLESQSDGLDHFTIEDRLRALGKNKNFLWLMSQLRAKAESQCGAYNPHPLPYGSSLDCPESAKDALGLCQDDLTKISAQISEPKRSVLRQAVEMGDVATLMEYRLLKADLTLHGGTIRGKKREELMGEITKVDQVMRSFGNQQRLSALNATGEFLSVLYQVYSAERDALKLKRGHIEFDDTAKGCFRLFSSDDAMGARYLIHKRASHLLLDEFQDTSRLQWHIFSAMSSEMLSGDGLADETGLKPTVFIVGDEKQSIYGFREADALILSEARQSLEAFGATTVPLNHRPST